VHHVGLPLLAEKQLAFIEREKFFQRGEDDGGAEQVEDEPVQADVWRVVGEIGDSNVGTPARRWPTPFLSIAVRFA